MITLPNGFTVTPNSNPAVLVKTTPNKVALNQTLPITITVNNANFSQATNNTMYLSHQGTSTIINPTSGSVMGLNNSHIRGTYTFSGSGLAVGSAINSHCGNSFDGTFSDFSAITITAPTTISGAINYVGNYTGVVELYQEVPNANPSAPPYYSLVASSNVVGNNYSFTNVAEADYYIRSVPVGMSDVVATYYAADISWQTATLVTTNPTVPSVCNITPITSLSLGSGAVNVNGTLGYGPNGYNKAQIVLAEGVEVFLKDVTGNTFAQTVTDQNGEYSFNGLLNGDYEIVIDIPGFDQISTYSFNVSNSTQNLNGLDFVIDDGEIFISNFLGFDALDLSELLIYPNPTIGELNIELPSNLTNVQVAIYNTMGQIVYQENQLNIGSKTLKTDLTALTEGVYILKVQSDQYTSETRLVKVK
jgi:hypothetical protein